MEPSLSSDGYEDLPPRRSPPVPEVSGHGMRGLHSSLALAAGTSGHAVAASLGHESISTTLESYADPAAVSAGQQRAALQLLEGGAK